MSVQVGLVGVDVPLPSVEIDDEWLKAPLRGRSQGGRKEDPCGGTTGAGASPLVERPVCCKRTFRAWGVSPPQVPRSTDHQSIPKGVPFEQPPRTRRTWKRLSSFWRLITSPTKKDTAHALSCASTLVVDDQYRVVTPLSLSVKLQPVEFGSQTPVCDPLSKGESTAGSKAS